MEHVDDAADAVLQIENANQPSIIQPSRNSVVIASDQVHQIVVVVVSHSIVDWSCSVELLPCHSLLT